MVIIWFSFPIKEHKAKDIQKSTCNKNLVALILQCLPPGEVLLLFSAWTNVKNRIVGLLRSARSQCEAAIKELEEPLDKGPNC